MIFKLYDNFLSFKKFCVSVAVFFVTFRLINALLHVLI